jgi:hypothetical protein
VSLGPTDLTRYEQSAMDCRCAEASRHMFARVPPLPCGPWPMQSIGAGSMKQRVFIEEGGIDGELRDGPNRCCRYDGYDACPFSPGS